jgi:hypothetical protein
MKKFIASLICFLSVLYFNTAYAQVSISIRQPLSYQLKVTDLFNADLINTSGQPIRIYLKGSIQNIQARQLVVEAKSAEIELLQGAKTISSNSVNPSYQYYGDAGNVSATGQLPYGNYQVCLKAYSLPDNEEVGDACITVEISPLSPPLLLSPDNGSEAPVKNPLLVWLPPTPVNKDMKVLYDLKLVELMPNQTAYDAIQRNFALLDQKDIRNTNLQYPANAIALEEGKTYAWQVIAKTDQYLIGQTEVWTFKLALPKDNLEEVPVVNKNYIRMKKEKDATYVTVQHELKVVYEESYAKSTVIFTVYDAKQQEKGALAFQVDHIGDNQFVIDLTSLKGLKDKEFYVLEASASGRGKQYLRFKNIK